MPKVQFVHIENVVASVTIDQKIDLEKIARSVLNVEYDPEQFPGLVYRLEKPKTATLIFNSGKMVCTGAKSEKEVHKAVNRIVKELQEAGIIDTTSEPIIQIQNIVASASLGTDLNLELGRNEIILDVTDGTRISAVALQQLAWEYGLRVFYLKGKKDEARKVFWIRE